LGITILEKTFLSLWFKSAIGLKPFATNKQEVQGTSIKHKGDPGQALLANIARVGVQAGGPGGPALPGLTDGVFLRLARGRLSEGFRSGSPEVRVAPVRSIKTVRVAADRP
jgi:hypothetical protein